MQQQKKVTELLEQLKKQGADVAQAGAKRPRAANYAVPAERANRQTYAPATGRGMKETNEPLFSWLTQGAGEESGMATVA